MTDDDRLMELFTAAASDSRAPAPGFDHGDVVAASRRITARRRSVVIGGAIALFAVVGVGAAVAVPGPAETASTAAAPAAAPEAARERAAEGELAADSAAGGAPAVPMNAAPLGPGSGDCADRQDPALRAYLEQVLPEVIGAPAAASTDQCLPGAQRYLALEVDDGGVHGLFGVSYLPPGTIPSLVEGAVSAPTASGGTVIVHSRADAAGSSAPFADRVDAVAAFLAPRL
jgi:hypothetical protein